MMNRNEKKNGITESFSHQIDEAVHVEVLGVGIGYAA